MCSDYEKSRMAISNLVIFFFFMKKHINEDALKLSYKSVEIVKNFGVPI